VILVGESPILRFFPSAFDQGKPKNGPAGSDYPYIRARTPLYSYDTFDDVTFQMTLPLYESGFKSAFLLVPPCSIGQEDLSFFLLLR